MSNSGAGADGDPHRNPMEVDIGPDDEGGGGGDAGAGTTSSSSSWRFDPLAFFCASSSYSPPPQSLSFLHFPSPPSPLWLFEDGFGATVAESQGLVAGNPDVTAGNGDGADAGVSWRLQIPPAEEGNSDRSCLIKERITQALRHFKESTDQHLLVQVWAPVRKGNRCVLTTSGQPFVLDPRNAGLLQYRMASVTYVFSADGDNDVEMGLPGRVFKQKVPEWTPNVQYYSSKEYPRLLHALNFDVRGTLALPVFEPSAQSCVAVVELIMTSQKINYAGEVDKVCKALEAVNLKSSEILDHPNVQICNEGRQAALAEILQILTIVCEEHKLPLAQTWVPCMHRSVLTHGGGSKKSCSSFDGSCMGQVCMSTTDVAFHVIDGHMWGFREACVEHHLQKKQGVAGRSFALRRPFFCKDIAQFCKTEYPLVHYARMFHLAGCFAVCLQSTHTGTDDYILEFFLPTDCKGINEQRALLKSMTALMLNCFYSLKIITDDAQEEALEGVDMFVVENEELEPKCINIWMCESDITLSTERVQEHLNDLQNSEKLHSEPSYQKLLLDSAFGENKVNIADSNGSGNISSSLVPKNDKPPERRRGKAEKKISLEVLKQYFTGSLKDAAKSLGVCPTTMKRICRQHGINRWPSRKINKVNRSLSKLRRVIESVQGTDGAFNLTAYTGPLPVDVGSISWPVNLDGLTPVGSTKTPNLSERDTDDLNLSPGVGDRSCPQKEFVQNENVTQLKLGKGSRTKSGSSSGHGSTQTPTSEGSCQESPVNETHVGNQLLSSIPVRVNGDSLEFTKPDQNMNIFSSFQISDANVLEPRTQPVGIVIQDSGSFKDLKDLCNPSTEVCYNEHVAAPLANPALPMQMQDSRTVTLKACYKEDIIRFRMRSCAGIDVLRNEVAKRLKLEVGTFDVKYLDDDHEWVMLTGNADLEECLEISRREGGHLIRLLVSDTFVNLGSSCESSGG